MRWRSLGRACWFELGDLPGDEVEHAAVAAAARRAPVEPPAPNSWSKAMRGSRIIGSGSSASPS